MTHPLTIILTPLLLCMLSMMRPRSAGLLSLPACLPTAAYAAWLFHQDSTTAWVLVDAFGVMLKTDTRTAWLLLTNALVSAAVVLDLRRRNDASPFLHTLIITLHAGINAAFICADLFSLYVALELTTITAGLLIGHPLKSGSVWNAFRYLFVSNIAMLFYLIGVVLVYESTLSFAIDGVSHSPPVASALLITGLLVKGGVFIPGLWLPFAHSEAEAPVSALLSGVLVKIAIFPLMTIALHSPETGTILRWIGIASSLFGVCFAIFETDVKRLLAFSTISQVGVMLAAPVAGAFYAFAHGIAKACLFLSAGKLPAREIGVLKTIGVDRRLRAIMTVAVLSLSGAPFLAGYVAKTELFRHLTHLHAPWMTAGAVGTALILAKLIFLPAPAASPSKPAPVLPVLPLLAGMLVFGITPDAVTMKEIGKALFIILTGWGLYGLIFRRVSIQISRRAEDFRHLIGAMVILLWVLIILQEAA